MNELRRRREQRKNGSQMELKTEFESGMRRVEVTDCGSCCRLAGICERMRNLEQGLL